MAGCRTARAYQGSAPVPGRSCLPDTHCFSEARDVQRADFPGLRRKSERGVSGTESLIAAPLHDLEKESFVENVGIDLEEFAVAFTVVQNPIGPKIGHRPGIQIVSGLDVVII